jgi:hypothetical protein
MAETRETRAFASEIKFVVDPAVADRVRVWARQHLQPDPHGGGTHGDEYRTTSLYFDTPALDVLNRRGSYGRAKFRVRRYADSDVVFLERKLRTSRLLTKRRTVVSIDDLSWLVAGDAARAEWPGRWMTRRLAVRRLAPVCQVAYRRMARGVEAAAGHARLTLDEAIHVTAVNGLRFSAAVGVPVLPASQILELKFRTHLPAVFTRLVEEFGLMPQTASKYRLSMAALHQHASQPASAGLDPVSARDAHA